MAIKDQTLIQCTKILADAISRLADSISGKKVEGCDSLQISLPLEDKPSTQSPTTDNTDRGEGEKSAKKKKAKMAPSESATSLRQPIEPEISDESFETAFHNLVEKKGVQAARDILSKYSATRVKDVTHDDRLSVYNEVTNLLG